jgi:hypothetical protein
VTLPPTPPGNDPALSRFVTVTVLDIAGFDPNAAEFSRIQGAIRSG